jgi:glutathione synthase
MSEAQRRGHENWACAIQDMMVDGGKPPLRAGRVSPVQGLHWKYGKQEILEVEQFDTLFMRKDPPFDMDFFFATHVQSLVDEQKTFVFNRASGLREANEKLFILRFPDLMPETFVSSDPAQLLGCCHKVGGDIVVKLLDGAGGMGLSHHQGRPEHPLDPRDHHTRGPAFDHGPALPAGVARGRHAAHLPRRPRDRRDEARAARR